MDLYEMDKKMTQIKDELNVAKKVLADLAAELDELIAKLWEMEDDGR